MIPIEPIDLSSATPFDPFSYYIHILVGLIAISAALIALFVRKGSKPHILAGRVFAIGVTIVAVSSLALLSVRMIPPLLVATFLSVYTAGTALLALRPAGALVKVAEYSLSALIVVIAGLFVQMSIPHVVQGNIPAIGPIVILAIPFILLIGDVNFYRQPSRRQELRVRRHLARMIWALVVVIRAPIVEVNVVLQIPTPLILIGPLVVAPVLIWFFMRKFPNKKAPQATPSPEV